MYIEHNPKIYISPKRVATHVLLHVANELKQNFLPNRQPSLKLISTFGNLWKNKERMEYLIKCLCDGI